VQECIACHGSIRKARVLAEITILLDATPTRRGSYYFAGDGGIVTEDRDMYRDDPTYRRHRCTTKVMPGWNGAPRERD
jgi:hypothetical protein